MAAGLVVITGADLPSAVQLVALALGGWGLVELGCLRGTFGPNRFGSDPLA